MKNILLSLIVFVLAGLGTFFYFTHPVEQPTQDISETSADAQLEVVYTDTQALYRIASERSVATFRIGETLRGEPFTAVGTTSQVSGDVVIQKGVVDATTSPPVLFTIGEVRLDARTFTTDSQQRDTALKRFILQTETPGNEFMVFVPSDVVDVPEQIVLGEPFTATLKGNMTIAGITHPVEFALTATQTPDTLSLHVEGVLKRSDFNLTIPNIPFVADVDDVIEVSVDAIAYIVHP